MGCSDDGSEILPIIHIEIAQESASCANHFEIEKAVLQYLDKRITVTPGAIYTKFELAVCSFLHEHVRVINISETKEVTDVRKSDVRLHVYRTNQTGCGEDYIQDDDNVESSASGRWSLPCEDFFGLWENLHYDSNIKEEILSYIRKALLYAECKVNPNIIIINRLILLHGPPGTGKTSLCKAVAQKVSIRLRNRYPRSQLLEINSHSLFSKWFSESGKLVAKLFAYIREIVDDPEALVFILIDEVESLTHSRQTAFAGVEPSDSIRAVNALLTELDKIRRYSNVFILTTSNITEAIDNAFMDRIDIKYYVESPSLFTIYKIYQSCIAELMKSKIIKPSEIIFEYEILEKCSFEKNESTENSLTLLELAKSSNGLSGRSLRSLPIVTDSKYFPQVLTYDLKTFLNKMKSALMDCLKGNELVTNAKNKF